MENRMLAQRPSVADIKDRPGVFVRQFDEWFKDSTGFREKLLVLYKAVNENKWLNNVVQYTDGRYVYLVVKKGHHYFAYTDGWMISKFQGKEFLSSEKMSKMAAKLEMVKIYLENKAIPLVVMFCTDKESVYPEYYPKSIKRGPEPIQLDVITNYLQKNTSVDVFNIRQALLAEKDTNLLYAVSSGDLVHYTQIGAFFAYRELMRHVNVYFPRIIPYELDDLEISYNEKGIPNIRLKSGFTYQKLDDSFFDDVDVYRQLAVNHAYQNTDLNLPVILFLCDSYADESLIGKYFAQKFGKTILIHASYINHIDDYISKYKPDIVIFESAERQLDGFADCVLGIPDLLK
jgi:hypothetical protein